MAVLLDTHTFLWWTQDDSRLSRKARKAIAGADCYLSLASCWEVAIKISLERLRLDRPVAQFFTEQLSANGISLLPIEFRHVVQVSRLPFHHRDPFDRLLVAQCLEEDMPLISADVHFDGYGVRRVW